MFAVNAMAGAYQPDPSYAAVAPRVVARGMVDLACRRHQVPQVRQASRRPQEGFVWAS